MPTIADPGCASRRAGRNARTRVASARRFTWRTVSNPVASSGSAPGAIGMPAACTRPPTDPSAPRVGSTPALMASGSRTSTSSEHVVTPNSEAHSSATALAPAPLRSHGAIARPTSARARHTARPIPEAPPVTTTGVPGRPSRSPLLVIMLIPLHNPSPCIAVRCCGRATIRQLTARGMSAGA